MEHVIEMGSPELALVRLVKKSHTGLVKWIINIENMRVLNRHFFKQTTAAHNLKSDSFHFCLGSMCSDLSVCALLYGPFIASRA